MALLSNLCFSILHGMLLVWLVEAQTETVYLTQIQTMFTACDCSFNSPSGLSVSDSYALQLRLADEG